MGNADLARCPDGCFRPVGLAWDGKGRLWMSSDSTGEVYVVTRSDGRGCEWGGVYCYGDDSRCWGVEY